MAFPIEAIPDSATLFRRIHRMHLLETGIISSAAYDPPPQLVCLSVNWEAYSTAEKTADENSYAVMAILAEQCRVLKQTVEHTPVNPAPDVIANQAHADMGGNLTKSIKRQLRDKATVVWSRPAS